MLDESSEALNKVYNEAYRLYKIKKSYNKLRKDLYNLGEELRKLQEYESKLKENLDSYENLSNKIKNVKSEKEIAEKNFILDLRDKIKDMDGVKSRAFVRNLYWKNPMLAKFISKLYGELFSFGILVPMPREFILKCEKCKNKFSKKFSSWEDYYSRKKNCSSCGG